MAPTLASSVTELPRVSAADSRRLERLGIRTVQDLLLNLPFAWESFENVALVAQARPGSRATVIGTVASSAAKRTPRRQMRLTEATIRDDEGGLLKAVWFNQPYLSQQLRPGLRVALAGLLKASRYGPGLEMQSPHLELLGEQTGPRRIGGLMPKYHLTAGLSSRRMAAWVEAALPLAEGLPEPIPEAVRSRHGLLPIAGAVRAGQHPDTEAEWHEARRRMAFAELLELQVAFLLARRRQSVETATAVPYQQQVIDRFKGGLGFELTRAQRRSAWEIFQDLAEPTPMNRLLNGDVGSGKTAVAAAAVAMTHAAGLQSVVMAPTEILARQHLGRFRQMLEASFPDLRVEMLVSGLSAAEGRRVRMAAASGHCALLVGTHALIEDQVQLAALGLAVVDEQHRFGTRQRELLRAKSRGSKPHFLAMTATPIPRSLALALYGEMALSTIDEMPPGRTPVSTEVINPEERGRAYEVVRREVAAGHQAFVICPLIEESETLEVKAATAEFERLQKEVFPDLRLALVHGRMKDKDRVMTGFAGGESDILVATPVIEVGVDVPNATVMMIEGADRFGLAQLHQFRGRVGRGALQSQCLLLVEEPSEPTLLRLRLLTVLHDGFQVAREDMRLRGAGELMGARQHGMTDLAMEALEQPELLSEVRQEAEAILAADPGLADAPALRAAAARRLEHTSIS